MARCGSRSVRGSFRQVRGHRGRDLGKPGPRAEEGGVTDCMTMPWMYYSGRDCPLEQKLDGMERFAEDVIRPLS